MFKLSPIRWGILGFLLIDLIGLGVIGYRFYRPHFPSATPQKVHFHAGFQVYIDGQLQDFSDFKYMNTTPCQERDHMGESTSPEQLQIDKAHLHDGIGNVVHVHVAGGVWGDLFKNIKYDILAKGTPQGYVNGKAVNNILSYPIKGYDSVIILIGKSDSIDHYLPQAVTKDTIIEAEKKSELCGI
jgi:hypothetical protein